MHSAYDQSKGDASDPSFDLLIMLSLVDEGSYCLRDIPNHRNVVNAMTMDRRVTSGLCLQYKARRTFPIPPV